MLDALKFCAGSVSRKDIVQELKHFTIQDGFVRGFNGSMALCSPIPFDINCRPEAEQLIKAVANCEETIQLSMTKAGRLSVKSGVFKASIPCVEDGAEHPGPEGVRVDLDGEAFLKGIRTVAPFIGTDASRVWVNGALFRDASLFATNNVVLVEYWVGSVFPDVINIPRSAIREMLRIGEPPTYAQVAPNSVTFHYEGHRWLRTQLYDHGWPDLAKIFNRDSVQQPLDNRIFEGLEAIKPFLDKMGSVFFEGENMQTGTDADEGAVYNLPGFCSPGRYNAAMLALLKGAVTTIDWSSYPGPCLFLGERLRGAIIGMRK
jgi:hypothetical protein